MRSKPSVIADSRKDFRGPRSPYLSCCLLFLAVVLGRATCYPQAAKHAAEAVRITGDVRDQSGAALPRTLVQVRDSEGRLVAATQTNSRGGFTLDVRPGRYVISAILAGFAPLKDQPVEVTHDPRLLSLILEVPSPQQEIIVTATKTETPLSQVGSSVTVMSGRQLAGEGIATVADALRRVAGLTVVQSGGFGQVTSLFIRGGGSNYTKVLIDGIPVNEPGGTFNFAYLSTTGIDRIEVVRGPQSALFGTDATAGVVQIFTRRGTSEGLSPKPSAMIEGGTFASYRYGGGVEGKGERVDYSVFFSRFDTDNNVSNGSFNDASIAGNLGFRPTRNSEIRAVFRSEAGRSGVPGQWAFERPDQDAFYRNRNEAGSLTFTYLANTSWTQKVSYVVNDSRQFSADAIDSGSYVPQFEGRTAPFPFSDFTYQTLNQTRRQKVNYQSDLILPHGHVFTAGADYERESGTIGDPQLNPTEAFRDNYGSYFQDQWSFHNRFFTTTGVRLEHNASFGFFAAPRLSIAYHAHEPVSGSLFGLTKLKANFGLGIKEPSLIESFSNSPFFMGNPNLRPERALSFDAGIEQHFGSGRDSVEVTYFENHFRNQIGFNVTDFTTFSGTFFNIGKTRARGVELVLRRDLGWNWEISGAYTYTDAKVLESTDASDPAFARGQELFRRPRHSGYLDISWKPGHWDLRATGIFVGSRVDSDFSSLGMTRNTGYSILDLLAGYKIGWGSSLFVACNNALNARYMEVLGYPALRANFRVGIRTGF
ncbi:MAG TPA: TonB-dependent receptor [Acidobacteriota bacterium]|nr:TonB-dependent receptor [Acidobacteriota bacterium]